MDHSSTQGGGAFSSQSLASQDIGRLAEELLKRERQVDWVTALLTDHLVALRASQQDATTDIHHVDHDEDEQHDYFPQTTASATPHGCSTSSTIATTTTTTMTTTTIPLDEVLTHTGMDLPTVRVNYWKTSTTSSMKKLPLNIKRLLREFVSIMAAAHRPHAFHNFTHSCQVVGVVAEHVQRHIGTAQTRDSDSLLLHPLAVVAILFAAMIHDVDHPGAISNTALCTEQPWLGHTYRHVSVARQHALDIAWQVFLEDDFRDLREYMFGALGMSWQVRFRQVLIHTVLATDVSHTTLNQQREQRLQRLLSLKNKNDSDSSGLRTALMLEFLLRAAYVAHVMQGWPAYQEQNQQRFQESMTAFEDKRLAVNPSKFWYKMELRILDSFAIPLVQTLQESKLLGDADQLMENVKRNRTEWQKHGESIVAKFAAGYHRSPKFSTSLASVEEQMASVALQDDSPLFDRHRGSSSKPVDVEDGAVMYTSW
mmetsp:Transcript_6373/g.13128  ORF Transcript_6373/g.13128 Transcript_6373/m.13128 type:complete len:483 (+) Transcript_6373:54-1502(+)